MDLHIIIVVFWSNPFTSKCLSWVSVSRKPSDDKRLFIIDHADMLTRGDLRPSNPHTSKPVGYDTIWILQCPCIYLGSDMQIFRRFFILDSWNRIVASEYFGAILESKCMSRVSVRTSCIPYRGQNVAHNIMQLHWHDVICAHLKKSHASKSIGWSDLDFIVNRII